LAAADRENAMLTCKEVTHLVSQSQDRPLRLGERISLRLHLRICNGCRNFSTQLDLIRRACRRLAAGEAPFDDRDR